VLHRVHQLSIFAIGCIVIYFGVLFTGQLPDHPLISGYNDILLHASAFGLLTLIALPATACPIHAIAILFIFAAAIELVQLTLPDRTATLSDLLASSAGIAISWILLSMIIKLLRCLNRWKRYIQERINA
jgi:hypothetical protein